jgi:hypothetical protein
MKKTQGSVSVYVLLTMMVLLTASLGVTALSVGSLGRATNEKKSLTAFEGAQASLEWSISKGYKDMEQNDGFFIEQTYELSDVINPVAPSANAWARIVPQPDATWAWITGNAYYKGTVRSVRSLVRVRNVNIWNNAVFAGTGAGGRAIDGNVDIRGSMHILGDGEAFSDLNNNAKWDAAEPYTDSNKNGVWDPGEPFTDNNGDGVRNLAEPYNDTNWNGVYDPPLTQTDLNSSFYGDAHVGNHYSGMPVSLEALIPPAPKINGIEQLNSEVRVKHGQIAINGTATIGTDKAIDGGTSKSKIDGAYVSDGWTGNQGASQVYSDNGTNTGYDLNHIAIQMPIISGIGAQEYKDPNTGVIYTTEEQYLDAKALTIPVNTITAATSSFSYGPDANGNAITWDKATGTLNLKGVIRVVGDLQIGVKDTIRYTGNGTIYATQDIKVDGNFLPAAGTTFPTTARAGLIAKRHMLLAAGAGSAQLSMAGAFYAQGTVFSRKQNQILGTFVGNFYDMGTNVPNIYQVPDLVRNMPPAMPGDRDYYTIKSRSWRQRDASGVIKG